MLTHKHTIPTSYCLSPPQEIDELLGQNLTQEDEDAIAAELESIIAVSACASSLLICLD